MSGKEQNYQEIQRQGVNDPGLLNARMQQAEKIEREKGLPSYDANKYLMDAEQLKEYYENRNRDTEKNSFRLRTKYYFEDMYLAEAKAARYERLSKDQAAIEDYENRHGGRQTYKRVNDVKNASASFRKMQQVITKQVSSNRANLTPLQKYNQREEIMKYRMEGMVAAAQLKSKPGNMHHLVTRAKYSCYMVLKDQLAHLIKEQQSARDRSELENKLNDVNIKLDSLYEDLKKYTPSIQKQWQEDRFTSLDYETAHRSYQAKCNINVVLKKDTTKTLFHLQKFHENNGDVQWPARCVYKTKEGNAPINSAERKLQEWNNRVQDIRENGTKYAKHRVEMEGIRLFMNTELPSAKTLITMGVKYLEDNMRTYYEMTHMALPYYRAELEKGEGVVAEYAEYNRSFEERLDYIEAIKNYMEHRLRKDHGIKADQEKWYAINKTGAGDNRLTLETEEEALLGMEKHTGIYIKQEVSKFGLMPEIPVNAEKGEDDDDEYYEDEEENVVIVENRLFSDMMVKNEEKKEEEKPGEDVLYTQKLAGDVQKKPDVAIVENEEKKEEDKEDKKEEKIAEPKNEIIEEKEEAKNEIIGEKEEAKNEIIEDDDGPLVEDSDQEEKKVAFADTYNQLEKELESLKEQDRLEQEEKDRRKAKEQEELRKRNEAIENGRKIVEEHKKREEADKEAKKKANARAEKVNENKINENRIIEEPKNVINENRIIEEPKNRIIVEKKETRDLGIKDPKEMKNLGLTKAHFGKKATKKQKEELEFAKKRYEINQYYKQAKEFENHEEYQSIYKKTGIKTSMGRALTAMMRPVMFDRKGNPLPKYQKNHQWNLRWLNAWANKDEKEKEKMLAEYYPHAMDVVQDSDFPEMKLNKSQIQTLKNLQRIVREIEGINAEMEARKKTLEKLKKDVSNAALMKDSKYAELEAKRKDAIKRQLAARSEAVNVAKTYASSKQFKTWLNNSIEDRSEQAFNRMIVIRGQTSVDELKKMMPSVKTFENNNPKRVRREFMINKFSYIQQSYLSTYYGIQTGAGGGYVSEWERDENLKPGELDELQLANLVDYMGAWVDYHYEETQGPDDAVAEIAELQEVNRKFKKKDYAFYKKLKSVKEFTDHPLYAKYDIQETRKKYNLPAETVSLDRFARIGFRPVAFDKLNQPVTKEDEANHAWNLKWLRAWKEDDVATREAMIGEQLSRIFKDIQLPVIKITEAERKKLLLSKQAYDEYEKARIAEEKCPADAPNKKELEKARGEANKKYRAAQKDVADIGQKYGSAYAKWLEGLVDRQDLNMLNLGQIAGCTDHLQKIHPSVAYFFEKNPALKTLTGMVNLAVRSYTGQVVGRKCRIKMSTKVEIQEEMEHHDDLERYDQDMADEGLEFLRDMVLYEEQKKKKMVPFVPLSDNETSITDPKEQEDFAKRYLKNPNLTPKSYRVLKVFESSRSILNHPEYTKEYQKADDVLGGTGELSRDAVLVMRNVNFDQNGKPVSKQDEENHKWNMQWLKAIQEDDFELREKMLSEEIPKRFWIKDLPQPPEELLSLYRQLYDGKAPEGWHESPEGQKAKESYQKELLKFQKEVESFTEKKLEAKDVPFFYEMQSGQSLDKLMQAHPSLKQYMDNNPEIAQRCKMLYSYMTMTGAYCAKKYLISGWSKIDHTKPEDLENRVRDYQDVEDASTGSYLNECLKYQNVKKTPYVPYQTTIREEDRQRKEKRAVVNAEKEKAAQKKREDENQKQYAELAKQYQKINPEFNTSHIERLVKTNLRGKTFQNKEYLALAKKIYLGGMGKDLSGAISVGLETIEMDKNGNVLPEYKEAHEKNLAWLNMLVKASDTEDMREVTDYIEKTMTELVKEFELPNQNNLSTYGSYRLIMGEPVKMKTMIQRLQAYEKMKKGIPEIAVTSSKKKVLKDNIRLLLNAVPLLLDNVKVNQGIDLSGDEYKVIAVKDRSNAKEAQFNQMRDTYLKERESFLKDKEKIKA